MCGIAGIVLKEKNSFDLGHKIVSMSDALSHRGPDGEGFIFATENTVTPCCHTLKKKYERGDLKYIPQSPVVEFPGSFLAFAHRRLSIIDLSESGHQPMCNTNGNLWIVFNGEIYNYIELRDELKTLGHTFVSESDTEVVLMAYTQWGQACVEKFNGMWAFCIYDREKKICFASRDRLGVKPFYYVNTTHLFSFASEQKAFIKSGIVRAKTDQKALHNYLINDLIENTPANFFDGILELWPGNNLVYDLRTSEVKTMQYFHLNDHLTLKNEGLNEKELVDQIASVFEHSVKLRLRSDVEVGTCLSGGIDSSALAVTIAELTRQPLYCFTSIFSREPFNEEHFANIVAKKINARHFKIEPTLDGFLSEVDALVYSQDVPIWSTSTYAQYKVMELAKQHGIKVVLDGQGADELFGGYHHHLLAHWNNLLAQGRLLTGIKEIAAAKKTINNPFVFYLKERLKEKNNFNKKQFSFLFKNEFVTGSEIKNPHRYFDSVNDQLINDIYETRLKSFLKCEDRCGMWHSVESRTPFSDDIDLISLLFSFNGNRKIKNGVSKHLLREALKPKLPREIYSRYDKIGFETPMQKWMLQLKPQIMNEVKAAGFDFVDYTHLEKTDHSGVFQNKLLFKLFILARWQKLFAVS